MDLKRVYSYRPFILVPFFVGLLAATVSGCFDCFETAWDFLLEDLILDVCPTLASTTSIVKDLFSLSPKEDDSWVTSDMLSDCLRCGRELSRAASRRANQLVKNGAGLETCSPALLHFFSNKLPSDIKKTSEMSHEIITATKLLQMKLCTCPEVTPNTFLSFLEHQVIKPHELYCKPVSITCSKSQYRSIDGTCNNERRPAWGRRGAPFTRIATPRLHFGECALDLHNLIPSSPFRYRTTRRTDHTHPFVVDVPTARTKRFASSFLIRTAKDWNDLPASVFPSDYNVGLFKQRVNRLYLSIYAMPVAKSGRQLPNPRTLSTRIFADFAISSRVFTYLSMQWGQFITHDLLFQVMEVTDEGGIQCCLGNGQDVLPPEWLNDKCIPICVPDDDPFYRQHGIRCLNFVRSITTPRDDCSLGHAEQTNTVTSFMDGSPIYGSDSKLASKLRSKSGGRLKEETKMGCKKGFLPSVPDKAAVCDLRNSSEPCYLAGDSRINQTPTLSVLHTLLLREHNRVADILSCLNPLWSDEKLYQEARRVVIAEIQHITYQEWLPINFGENYFRYHRISPTSLYSHDYDEDVNPGIINCFGAGAFRFLHSIIPDSIMTCPSSYQCAHLYKLSDHYFNPSLVELTSESVDDIIRGIIMQSAGESDPHCTGEVTNLLFKSHNKWGLDLISMDIQRGRDHGLASYNDYREICGLRRATTFQDLAGEMSQDRINALAQLYECVDDVDLFVGGALEQDVQGSILGHTFQCIVAEQFYRTRIGDKFFYDNGQMRHSFTPEQLKEIKKASMARLICDNTEGVKYVQKKAFEVESSYNPRYCCDDYDSIPYVDLTAWKRPKYEIYD